MQNLDELQVLADRFEISLANYKDNKNAYNEYSRRIEYNGLLLCLLGWDVANAKGLAPQYREVVSENYSTQTDQTIL